jgi:transketolase
MSHHSLQDIAVMRAIPGIDIILPADRFETKLAIKALLTNKRATYVRIGRNAVADIYESDNYDFQIGKAVTLSEGNDLTIIATGELVKVAVDTAAELKTMGVACRVLNMHTIKPLDEEAIIKAAKETGKIITLEEHSIFGGLGSAVAEVVIQNHPVPVKILGIPDEPAIPGKSQEVLEHYGLCTENIKKIALQFLK